MKGSLRALAAAGAMLFSTAHVGSPDTFFEGTAGPYPVRVIVRTPGIVPGLAEISVRLTGAHDGIRAVTVLPLRGGIPTAALPPPDTARVVPGDTSLYAAQLWLMTFGAYSVQVTVAGAAGEGSAIVPVMAVPTRRLAMNRPVAVALVGLGVFLFVGALTIVGAAVREAVLTPGAEPDPARHRRAWLVMVITVPVLGLGVFGGKRWWDGTDASFVRGMYRPLGASATVIESRAGPVLRFAIADSAWLRREWSPLIPDHGHLMHLFVIGEKGFGHLHPIAGDSNAFDANLPPLPTGHYRIYADIVHESGFAQTLTAEVDLAGEGEATAWTASDGDDGWTRGTEAGEGGRVSQLEDGSTMTWLGDAAFVAQRDVELQFAVRGPRGSDAALQPYMGLASHAVIARDDGAVFIHLHPLGTIAMASQLAFALRQPGDTVRGQLGRRITKAEHAAMEAVELPGAFSFPYAFPQPGRYRLWVQVKRGGRILTATFATDVAP